MILWRVREPYAGGEDGVRADTHGFTTGFLGAWLSRKSRQGHSEECRARRDRPPECAKMSAWRSLAGGGPQEEEAKKDSNDMLGLSAIGRQCAGSACMRRHCSRNARGRACAGGRLGRGRDSAEGRLKLDSFAKLRLHADPKTNVDMDVELGVCPRLRPASARGSGSASVQNPSWRRGADSCQCRGRGRGRLRRRRLRQHPAMPSAEQHRVRRRMPRGWGRRRRP